jgi:hypothetical protein
MEFWVNTWRDFGSLLVACSCDMQPSSSIQLSKAHPSGGRSGHYSGQANTDGAKKEAHGLRQMEQAREADGLI